MNTDKRIVKANITVGLESQYNLVGDLRRFTIDVDVTNIYNKNSNRLVLLNKLIESNLKVIANIHTLNLLDINSNEAYSFRYDKINYICLNEILSDMSNDEEFDKVNLYPMGGHVF